MDRDWRQLINSYPPEKKDWDRTYPWIAYVVRPISFPLSWVLHKAAITGNMVTVFTGVLGLVSLPTLASGNKAVMMAGALCILLYNLLDCVDGNLARAWPSGGPPVGKFWDQMVGNFYWLSYLFLGIGLGTMAGLLLGSFITVQKYLTIHTRSIFVFVLGETWEKTKNSSTTYQPHTGRWYYKAYYNLTDLQGHAFLLPPAVFFDLGEFFLMANFVVSTFEVVATLALYLDRSVRMKE